MDNQRFIILVVRSLSGEATQEELKDLARALEEKEEYKKEFNLIKNFWLSKNSIRIDTEEALKKVLQRIDREQKRKINSDLQTLSPEPARLYSLSRFVKIAVAIAAFLIGAYFIFRKHDPEMTVKSGQTQMHWKAETTPRGTKDSMVLSDGTRVILNSESKLQFPSKFSVTKREVYLSGEAYFDVKHDEKVPFIIHTSKMNIRVLGTEFNVKSYPEESTSEATLIRGIIEVTLNDRPSDKIILRPKEKLIVTNETSDDYISPISPKTTSIPDTRLLISNLHYMSPTDSAIVETSWIENKLVFRNEDFKNLALDLDRKYNVNIRFQNSEVKNYRFTGIFEKETIEQALKALQMTEKFQYKVVNGEIIIY